ncbi:hypothetical protein [Cyclobacterium xiamenense]|uniref:hypothetical protein n=1 Tax=Cyclobacterium xiamenense TaxID=1297121 RepID=UPI0012B8734E|nr:hypothetical protein [Cyclobacterium xiamenense]
MTRFLFLFFVISFTSAAAFGQSPWIVKSFPNASNSVPSFSDFGSSTSKAVGNDFLTAHTLTQFTNKDPFGWNDFNKGTRLVLPVKVARAQWNMPIVDLSKGFSSKLPIKSSFGDFSSRMPIVGEKLQLPESGRRYLFEGTPLPLPGGPGGASVFTPGR